ncbi:MAG: YSC84-related protein [Woeseiaceae bacterium]
MKRNIVVIMFLAVAMVLPLEADALFGKKSVEEQREEILKMREETLARLYKEKPSAEKLIEGSVGYAAFSNRGINVLLVSTANGKGVAHDNESGQDFYMNMFSAGGGVGLGVKKFSAVFVFHSRDAYDQFVEEGWNFSGQADAAATTDAENEEEAGSMETAVGLNEDVTIYQMTDKGLALQITLQGTKYWKDGDLN